MMCFQYYRLIIIIYNNWNKYGSLFPLKNYQQLSKIIIDFYFNKKKYNTKIKKAFESLDRFDEIKNCKLYLVEIKKLIGII